MDIHELSFAKIILLKPDIAEVIVDEGVEITLGMVDEYHDFLLEYLEAPFSLLINKVNTYSYDFEAQQKIAALKEICCMAVVAYTRVSKVTTEGLRKLPREVDWNLEIFDDREKALSWLHSRHRSIAEGIA